MSLNLVDIAQGWHGFITSSPVVKIRMANRLAICDRCPEKEQVDRFTKALIKVLKGNDPKNLFRCGKCKCPLASLTAAPGTGCKLKKW